MYAKYATLRDKKGLTDYQVAKESGIAFSTIYDWKANRSTPKADKLMKIAKVLGVKVDTLLK